MTRPDIEPISANSRWTQSFSFRGVLQRIPKLDDLELPQSFATRCDRTLRSFTGEIRDRDSIQAAMQAGDTGHLVLATLHADSVNQAIDRIREFHPATEQDNAGALLARGLNAIVCQRLLPSTFKKRVPCLEIMKRNSGTQWAIARNDLHLLTGHIEASLNEGMHSFDQYLLQLLKGGFVTDETARHYAVNWSKVDMQNHGFAPQAPGLLRPDPDR